MGSNDCKCRLGECGVCYHEDQLEGVVRVTRSLLHVRYPHYLQEGYEVLKSKPPVIYSNIASPLGIVQHICRQVSKLFFVKELKIHFEKC